MACSSLLHAITCLVSQELGLVLLLQTQARVQGGNRLCCDACQGSVHRRPLPGFIAFQLPQRNLQLQAARFPKKSCIKDGSTVWCLGVCPVAMADLPWVQALVLGISLILPPAKHSQQLVEVIADGAFSAVWPRARSRYMSILF